MRNAGVLFDLDETLIDRRLSIDGHARRWFVGDDPTADVWGAKQVRLSAAWIPRHVAWPDDLPMCQDARLSDASEVLTLL